MRTAPKPDPIAALEVHIRQVCVERAVPMEPAQQVRMALMLLSAWTTR